MTKLPDALRTEMATAVEAILAPDTDLRALAEEMNAASGALRTQAWIGARPIGFNRISDINNTLKDITRYVPDLTLLTHEEGSAVYMRRWWLRRELSEDGHGCNGHYVHLFENDDPVNLHNHPWASASLLLHGGPIFEDTREGTSIIHNRQIVVRPANHRHRIRLRNGPPAHSGAATKIPAMTLFCTGERVQEWGFEKADGSIEPAKSTTGETPRRGEAAGPA